MKPSLTDEQRLLLRQLPKVDQCLKMCETQERLSQVALSSLTQAVRQVIEEVRREVIKGKKGQEVMMNETAVAERVVLFFEKRRQPNLRPILNGTGVVVHTNLGRAPLPASVVDNVARVAQGYSNLEFNLTKGCRGSRYEAVEELLCEVTGAEACLVVNNNAAAVLLCLDTFGKGQEVIVSRGELVEIGGSFRIPDIMARSGARLVEVGTTNRTHFFDYEEALTAETALLMKVHTSNYRVVGFTKSVSAMELVKLGQAHGVPVIEDLGSGSLLDMSRFGLEPEPTVQEVVAAGVDLVTFSGDKLLGGPQAGIIVGRRDLLGVLKKNQLTRALRVDKFTLAALEPLLRFYLDEKDLIAQIPTLQKLAQSKDILKVRAEYLLSLLPDEVVRLGQPAVKIVSSMVGGGALPAQRMESYGLLFSPKPFSVAHLERKLRLLPLPVIGRVEDGQLILDMRTITDDEVVLVSKALLCVFTS